MSNPTPTGQDEARRALAEALDYFRPHWATNSPVMLTPEKMRQHLAIIEAALRAPSLDRGAEEMRETCAQLCDKEANVCLDEMESGNPNSEFVGKLIAGTYILAATAIRALPVPADLNEGGGK